jgi:TrmH family RNA methyltransferase
LLITSIHNPKVKQTVQLRDRRHRDRSGEMLIEGYRELLRAVENGHAPAIVFHCPELFIGSDAPGLLEAAEGCGAALIETSRRVFEKLSYRDRPDGLLAVAPQIGIALDAVPLSDPPLLLIAESIEKPGNLGTMLRSADGTGVDAVVVCDRTTDINNPNVVRASVGALFAVPVCEVDSAAGIAFCRSRAIRIVAATPAAEQLYWDVDCTGPLAIVAGSEQHGLTDIWLDAADERIRIPMNGQADSLNVATAATLLMYEAVRQRSQR